MKEDDEFEVIALHFNVPKHNLPLREFIATASNTQGIIDAFNNEIFNGKLRYELLVVPPESGTFKSFLKVVITAAGGVLAVCETDIGKAFVSGLTGQEPAYWAKVAGEKIREAVKEYEVDDEEKTEVEARQNASLIVSEITKGFLQKDYDELRKMGISKENFREAYSARNEFYQACYQNDAIRSIGFDKTDDFPIHRRDFPRFIIDLPTKEDEEPDRDWVVEITHIKVTSPNWDRADETRQWKAKAEGGRPAFFAIDDEKFWYQVKVEELHTQVVDNLKVQWAFVEENGRRKHIHVLRVLEFNGDHISDPLDDDELKLALHRYERRDADQPRLF